MPLVPHLRLERAHPVVAPLVVLRPRFVRPVGVHQVQAGGPPLAIVRPLQQLVGVVEPVGPGSQLPAGVVLRVPLVGRAADGLEGTVQPALVARQKRVVREQPGVVPRRGQRLPDRVPLGESFGDLEPVGGGVGAGEHREVARHRPVARRASLRVDGRLRGELREERCRLSSVPQERGVRRSQTVGDDQKNVGVCHVGREGRCGFMRLVVSLDCNRRVEEKAPTGVVCDPDS